MKERDVVRVLKRAAREKVPCDEMQKERVIAAVSQTEIPVRKTGSFGEFLVSQISFINKLAFPGQLLWLMLFSYAVWGGQIFYLPNEILCILSMAPPVLLLLTVDDISHIYNQSMLEIEYATKYSLKKVVMVRLLILGGVSGMILLIGILYAKNRLGIDLVSVLAYSLTPYVCMMFLLLLFMKKWKGRRLMYAGITVYAVLLSVILIGRMEAFGIYKRHFLWVWLAVLLGGVFGTVYQFRQLWFRLEHFELVAD